MAWSFLTVGIALGSWWAYYELGWGGWWFWDPVENASFMPWLAGTALLHSLAVTEKRGAFKSWTVLLAIMTYSLCVLGAFIVRSGVLTSVHAFAVDPERGLFILALLGLTVGGSLSLYAMRAPTIRSRVQYGGLSRELMLLINNVLLVIAVGVVLLGTLFPLAYEAATGGDKISVGPPFFNWLFVPLMGLLAMFLAIVPVARWKRTPRELFKTTYVMLGVAAIFGVVLPLAMTTQFNLGVVLALVLALWIIATHVLDFVKRRGARPLGYLGMWVAHVGFAVTIIGIAVTSVLSHSKDIRLNIGESVELNERTYTLQSVVEVDGPNYSAYQAHFDVDGMTLLPEKRRYTTRDTVMTEAGIAPGFTRDLYISLGEPLPDGSWSIRVQDKPLVRWVWLGAIMMCLGGLIAICDVRYRRLAARDSQRETISSAATA